jgi:hypothetical protein
MLAMSAIARLRARAALMRLPSALLLCVLVTGFGWLAALPPFEGFDETAHYSYIQQLADTGTLPVLGESRLSNSVLAYASALPTAYSTTPPFEQNGGITYRDFSSRPVPRAALDQMQTPRRFSPSNLPNWQAQHPPLYYALMAPVYAATREWSWKHQFLALRALSWTMAFVGLAIGVWATDRAFEGDETAVTTAIAAAWPFLAPMFFPEMARLGNDSLCLLIAGAVWWLLVLIAKGGATPSIFASLGVLLGLGLLTKAFYLPITVGVLAWLALAGRWRGLGIALPIACLLGAPWYVGQYITQGVITGAGEQVVLAREGGMLQGLIERFAIADFLHALASLVATSAWAGTWSLARVPAIFFAPLVALLVLPFVSYCRGLSVPRLRSIEGVPLVIFLPLAAGLLHHVLMRIALPGPRVGQTGGWYVHILAGPLGFAFAIGVARIVRSLSSARLFSALGAYSLAYLSIVSGLQLLMYAGCVTKAGASRHYAGASEAAACVVDPRMLFGRLDVLATPGLAIPLLVAGFLSAAVALAAVNRGLVRMGVGVRG